MGSHSVTCHLAEVTKVKGGNVTSAGWQVTLCDPIWHVSSRSGVVLVTQTAIRFLTLHARLYPSQQRLVLDIPYSWHSTAPTPTRTSSPTCPPTCPTRALFLARILARMSVRDERVYTCKRVLCMISYRVHVYKIIR